MGAQNWKTWQFLIGEWTGEWNGESGRGSGYLTVSPDLQDKVLVRRTHVDFTAMGGHPAYAHDDLTIIRQEPDGLTLATYFDSDGHVIHTRAETSKDDNTIVCISDPIPGAPRFRFTYLKGRGQSVIIRFEISAPEHPEQYSVHTDGIVHKKK